MGIDTRAVIVVGVPYDELGGMTEEVRKELDECGEADGLDRFAPAFDIASKYCIFGIAVCKTDDYSYSELPPNLAHLISEGIRDFHEKTGLIGRPFLMPHIW